MNADQLLARALSLEGFTAFSLSGLTGQGLLPLEQALAGVNRSTFTPTDGTSWDAIANHLRTLQILHVASVATRVRSGTFDVVLLRKLDHPITAAGELAYFQAANHWLAQLAELLPSFQMNEAAKQQFTSLIGAAGAAAGSLAAMVGGLVLQLADAGSNVNALSLILIGSPVSPTFLTEWRATDMVTQPIAGAPWFSCWAWEWATGNPIFVPKTGFTDIAVGAGLTPDELTLLLNQAAS
jgi:hypothetical protein